MTRKNTSSKGKSSTPSTKTPSTTSTDKPIKVTSQEATPSPTPKPSGTDVLRPLPASEIAFATIPLIDRCSDAYWFPDSRFSISHRCRMAAVFGVIATEIESWAPSKADAKICHLQIMEIAARLRELANG